MIDAVLTYHMNPFACGVAKFNLALAKRLGVPCAPLGTRATHPLISIKTSEIGLAWGAVLPLITDFDLLLHDRPADTTPLYRASRVFYADELGCPSTLEGNPMRGALNVLLFGMAHKIHVHTTHIERLRDLLNRASPDYTVSVSTGVHETQPWDETFTKTITALRKVFGDHLRVLGYLGDDALARELRACHTAALFFEPAARANNTTIWAAMDAGCPVVTNLDADSPADFVHNKTVFNLAHMTDWPFGHLRAEVALGGKKASAARTWDKLVEILRA
mgnify:CR=1 FL=1